MKSLGRIKKKIKLKLLTLLLNGSNVNCNICNKNFLTFLPHLSRINASCPNCGSLERTRLLWYYMTKKELIKSATDLLHIAPEKYLYKIFTKNPKINYYPIDKFTEGYNYPSKTKEMDVTALSFDDNSMNGIICLHVLEHVNEDIKALKELYRVLKQNGWAIIQVPFDKSRNTTYEDFSITSPEGRIKHFGQSDHVRVYGLDFIERFKSAGFKVEDWNFQNTISKKLKEKYVFKDEDIFLLRK